MHAELCGGIPEAMREKTYDSFFTAETKKYATDIGLYMSKFFVEEHCKEKAYHEPIPNASRFCMEIPLLLQCKKIKT